MAEQEFGGIWTKKKLTIVEDYIAAYIKIMKNQTFNLIYIDAFAGCGTTETNDGQILDGSSVRAMKYPFDAFRFFEINKDYCAILENRIIEIKEKNKKDMWKSDADYRVIREDCNNSLMKINKKKWYKDNWRGVIFLDPYNMSLSWECLEEISKTQIFDVWYLFPFMALNRNLYKDISKLPQANKDKITNILGTDEWIKEIYNESPQTNLFGEEVYEKKVVEDVKKHILKRLETIFPNVSPNAVLLRNSVNSPIFLLCFMGSNPNPKAIKPSLQIADHILKHADMERV